jgi:uncharacterized membrane protein YvbJ
MYINKTTMETITVLDHNKTGDFILGQYQIKGVELKNTF